MHEKYLNKIKNKNEQIFKDYFFHQSSPYLGKSLYNSDKIQNDEIIKHTKMD